MTVNMSNQPPVGFAEPWSPENVSENGLSPKKRTNMKQRRSTTAEVLKMVNDHQIDPEVGNHYFIGPRDPKLFSKLPYALRLHGSILPKMVVALLIVALWSVIVTLISKLVYDLGISPILLTVLGFLVGLSLSYLNSTAYERYSDGRRAWSNVSLASRNLARMTWIFVEEREGDLGKQDLIGKISAINLILAFAISLKHRLRFEPYAQYPDLASLISHLDTFAKTAFDEDAEKLEKKPKSTLKVLGDYLGIPFLMDDERKQMKRSKRPLGNLPLEILTYMTAYYSAHVNTGPLQNTAILSSFLTQLTMLSDALTQAERVLSTPLPEAYSIVISQITVIYVFALPFQLYPSLGWITIPSTIASAYIILGMGLIAHEIENPFGHDVNDLPLDAYCLELAHELDSITSLKPPSTNDFLNHPENMVLWPLSQNGVHHWNDRGEEDIREGLAARVVVGRGKRVF